MKRLILGIVIAFLVLGLFISLWSVLNQNSFENNRNSDNVIVVTNTVVVTKSIMKISSPAFNDGGVLPEKYSCKGEGINPQLDIDSMPMETKSLALVVSDPDAPSGTFYHWGIWNIPPAIAAINEDSVPEGAIVGKNSNGTNGYIAPCPPSGTHHYIFTLYALNETLNLPQTTTARELESTISSKTLQSAIITALFSH